MITNNKTIFEHGMFVKEVGARSKGRYGTVTKVARCYVFVQQPNGVVFHRKGTYFESTTMEQIDRFAVDQTFRVGLKIECVGGSNPGQVGVVTKVCPKMLFCKVDSGDVIRRVTKKYAKVLKVGEEATPTTNETTTDAPPAKRLRKRARRVFEIASAFNTFVGN